jgi:hypothetical protein
MNGKNLVNRSVAGKKLKNGTLTSKQVKKDALTGKVIKESSLGTVPAAQTAASADSAKMAESATFASSAATADHATTAGDAEPLGGLTAKQLQVACPADTEPFGGMCWDEGVRSARSWIAASIECGKAGGRLPSLSELIAYVAEPGEQVSGKTWSDDVVDFSGEPTVLASDENSDEALPATSLASTSLGYLCLFCRVN